jgi:hypothetical protein
MVRGLLIEVGVYLRSAQVGVIGMGSNQEPNPDQKREPSSSVSLILWRGCAGIASACGMRIGLIPR